MIELAMEIPTCKLGEWSPYADLDFILAHTVLEDPTYAKFFAERPKERELILDNSYHELGYALSESDLLEAARRCCADYIISPDSVTDMGFTLKSFKALTMFETNFKIAVVMTGFPPDSNLFQRDDFLREVRQADMLCCTFKLPKRLPWFQESFYARRWKRVHLLGVGELEELRRWAQQANYLNSITWSVDTGKALKWALRGKKLDELDSLRSNAETTSKGEASQASQHLLSLQECDISTECEALFVHNVGVLKECCK